MKILRAASLGSNFTGSYKNKSVFQNLCALAFSATVTAVL